MFKTVCFLKRRPGLSFEDFVSHYETHHRKFGEAVMPASARFMRRYLHPVPNPLTGEAEEMDYDVLTEMWFEQEADFEAAMVALTEPSLAAEIAEDEEYLFDRSKIRFCTIEEHESALG